jgi:hypothetical protein
MDLTSISKKLTDATTALAKADKDLKLEMAGAAADVAGIVDPTPASDIVGAGISLARGDYWGAALSTASMIPYLGDAVAKPVKAVRATKAIAGLEKKVAALTKTVNDLKKAKKEAEAMEASAKEAKLAKEADVAKNAAAKQEKAASKEGKDCEDCRQSLNPSTRFYVKPDGQTLDAKNYSRNSGFREGVREKAWEDNVDPVTGRVTDPLTGKTMQKDEPWDMGHKPKMEYWKERDNSINEWLYNDNRTSRKKFLDRMNNPSRYRPELPSSNRSHRGEDRSSDFKGD